MPDQKLWECRILYQGNWNCTILGLYVINPYREHFSLTCGKADGLKHYVDWATKQGYGVIDVNIPKHLPDIDVSIGQGFSDHFVLT